MRRYEVGTDGTLDLGTASEKSVTCKITGSFTETPKIYAACEGHYTSTMEEVSKVSNTEYTVKITIKQTTAYAGDNKGGKLTVYCPYYGNTGIGQINLTAASVGRPSIQSTNIEPLTILEKEAKDLTASITFTLEGEGAPPSNDYCLPVIIDNYYTLTDVQSVVTNNGTIEVETGSGFSQNLDYEGNAEDGWIKLGSLEYNAGTFKQHFILDENKNTTPRTGAVVVFSPSGREVARFVIKQDAATPVIDATNLAVGQSANCYIISKAGRYELPAYMGAHKDLRTAPKCTGKPYEVWNDSENTITFLQANFSSPKIIFEITNASSETLKDGNAVIAIKDKDGNILWSWHLWLCDDGTVNESGVGEVPVEEYPTGDYVHARNLGSFSNYGDDGGIFYQWSRKDPLNVANYTSDPANLGGGEKATKNPGVFDTGWVVPTEAEYKWSYTSKSVNDPCPIGYKVPSPSLWSSTKPPKESGNYLLDRFYYADSPSNVFFAYTGSLSNDGVKSDGFQGTGSKDATYISGVTSYPGLYVGRINNRNCYVRYVNCTVNDYVRDGNLWSAANGVKLRYGFVDKSLYVNSCEVKYGTFGSWGKMDQATLDANRKTITDAVQAWDSALSLLSGYQTIYEKTSGTSQIEGNQIRCVKE